MERFLVKVRKEGRITLPKEVRDHLKIGEGATLRIEVIKVLESGVITLEPVVRGKKRE